MNVDRRLLRSVVLAFVLSRALLFAFLIAGSQTTFLRKVYGGTVWETRITLQSERVLPELTRTAMVGDAWWYRSIALRGYDVRATDGKAANWAFFPLYPLLVRTLSLTGEFALDGMLVSNVAFACALYLLAALALRSGFTADDAERAVLYLAFFPTSYFFSLPLTESLFLALSLGSVLAGVSLRWWLAGLLGGLAALTRLPGLLVIVPLFLILLQQRKWRSLPWLALVPAGTALFMAHLHSVTGDALAFVHVQQQWNRAAAFFATPLFRYAIRPQEVSEPWNLLALNFAVALLLFVAGCALLLARKWPLGAYVLVSVLLPLSSGSLQSIARYALVVFPLFFWLAAAGRRPTVDRLVLACSVALWGWLIAMLVLRVDYALN
jgi:Gpi18-like mannosyltransferase